MGRLANDPKKRKQLQIIAICMLVCAAILFGVGMAVIFSNHQSAQNADPIQTPNIAPANPR